MVTSPRWPSTGAESIPWAPAVDERKPLTPHSASARPYEAAVLPPIASLDIPLAGATFALADEASTEIARFDAEVGTGVAPYAPLLLRSESAASSRIENVFASATSIALAEVGAPVEHDAAIIVANTRAMEVSLALADRLDEQAILDVHEVLLESSHPEWVGHWRDQQVWIGGSGFGPHDARFVPPHHERVPEAMADLVAFMRRDDIPVLAQAAVAHAQFETVHPFPDGNGRTGRALIHSLLRAKRLTLAVTVPISAGLLADTTAYFEALTAYRHGDPAPIVELIAEASFRAVANGRRLASDLAGVRCDWTERITARRGAAAHGLADLLVRQPAVDSPHVQRELGVAATNANAAIEHLAEKEILTKVSGNYRNRKWAAPDVLEAFDDFADRAGPRSLAT